MRVYLLSTAGFATGGTELIHQFSKCLTDNGIENYMIYSGTDGIHCPTPPSFLKYEVKYVSQYIDAPDSILILAETQIHHINECVKGTAIIWWLSVDNYFNCYQNRFAECNYSIDENIDIFNLKERSNLIHLVQSHYAKDFVNSYFTADNCYFLMDYINDDIVDWAMTHKDSYQRQNICLYNPRKGYDVIKPVIAACRKDITWIPLMNMTPIEMADTMCKAKLYVDFGAHPGKDRIPREAAICGCCVLTNRKGSAAYTDDVNIPELFKIEDTDNINTVLEEIYDLIDNYDERIKEYAPYREMILKEKENFMDDVQKTIAILQEIGKRNVSAVSSTKLVPHTELLGSIGSAAITINKLTEKTKSACGVGNVSELMNNLLTIDYILQIIRETIYEELMDIS